MKTLKRLANIGTVAALLYGVYFLCLNRDSVLSGEYCTVAQAQPVQRWRKDLSDPPDGDVLLAQSRGVGKNRRHAYVAGHFYRIAKRRTEGSVMLTEIDGPIPVDHLRAYLSGDYLSDGQVLVYGSHRVLGPNVPIDLNSLRRLRHADIALSKYVTDGRSVLYEDHMLTGADAASLTLMAPPFKQEKGTMQQALLEFARDKSGVYYGGERISDEPANFRFVSFPSLIRQGARSYYAVDSTQAWSLTDGLSLVAPSVTEGIHQRLRDPLPETPEPWECPPSLKVAGWVLLALPAWVLIRQVQARISLRYQLPLFNRAVTRLSAAYLALPTVAYFIFFSSCSAPDDALVWYLVAGALASGAILLGIANYYDMRYGDAMMATAAQLGIAAVMLMPGTLAPLFLAELKSAFHRGSHDCLAHHQDVFSPAHIMLA